MSASKLVLYPQEFKGEPGTCVCGRVVLVRGPFELGIKNDLGMSQSPRRTLPASPGRSQKGRGKRSTNAESEVRKKIELHLLGGETSADILFLEAWGDAAVQVERNMHLGKVYVISGATVVTKTPPFSTSRLTYFLRVFGPIGVRTHIEECTTSPYTDLPKHHPFVHFSSLDRVQDKLQVCVLGILTFQPGLQERQTTFGPSVVCNAVLKQGTHEIRCSFWRDHAKELAGYTVGQELALFQVTVKARDGSWELYASEATQIRVCPADLLDSLRESTDVSDQAGPSTSLSKRHVIDYDQTTTTASTISGLVSVPVSQIVRELPGIFEVHSVAVLGVSGVSSTGTWRIRS